MQCVCGAAAAAPTRLQQQRPHRHTVTSKKPKFIRVRPLPAFTPLKYRFGAGCCASRTQSLEKRLQNGKERASISTIV